MNAPDDICGVVVTYQPDEHVPGNLRRMLAECGRLLVVDNGSSPDGRERLRAVAGVELMALKHNVGIAAALNVGARRAIAEGRRWIVTFDQDSSPRGGMVAALRAAAARAPHAAIVAPCIIEPIAGAPPYRWVRRHPRSRWWFQRVACKGVDLDVTMAVSSGSLVELETWRRLGGFDEGLFIDYVDVDYCLRVQRAGLGVVVAAGAGLDHRLGAREAGVVLGHAFRPTHHAAFRHYYMARNRVWTWRRHACAMPHWAVFDLCFAGYNALRVLGLERDRWQKMKAIALGTWDGLRGRSGPCPAHWLRGGG